MKNRRKQWRIIYRDVLEPTELCSDDGNSMIISGSFSRTRAFEKITKELQDGYSDTFGLKHEAQLQVAMLRRPNPNEDFEDMDANFYAEVINGDTPGEHDVWFYMYD